METYPTATSENFAGTALMSCAYPTIRSGTRVWSSVSTMIRLADFELLDEQHALLQHDLARTRRP